MSSQSRCRITVLSSILLTLALVALSLPQIRGLLQPTAVAATTFTVNSVSDGADSNTADGVCNDGSGNCTLRAALEQANATAGTDTINFSIGTGVKTIIVPSDLPLITDAVIIDGTTQPGFAGTPIIEINGNNHSNAFHSGFDLRGGSSTIRGLVINRFPSSAIALNTNGGNHIEGNYIGTDVTGTQQSANNGAGVLINTGQNVIGGTSVSQRNVLSGNNDAGIAIGAGNNLVQGNYIGVNAAGSAAVANRNEGIRLTGSNNHIGGTAAGAGNVISGNNSTGLQLGGDTSTVEGNFIGTNAAGTLPIPNLDRGIRVFNSPNNVIGGPTAASRNIISGNSGAGISLEETGSSANTVQGNLIGPDISGTFPLLNTPTVPPVGNSSGAISINRGVNNLVTGNRIAFNAAPGVWVVANPPAGTRNRITGNEIFGNLGLGIDLATAGITPNDPGDADTDANNSQNFPLLSSFVTGATTTVNGSLNSTPSTSYELEFYANSGCHASGNGEGARPLGKTTVTTDGSGNVSFSAQVGTSNAGETITATATDPNGNTSEFSPCDASKARGIAQFAKPIINVREDLSLLNVSVVRIGGTSGTLTVNYTTVNDRAVAGQDYTAVSGTLTFADGETAKTISVPITNDGITENPAESFYIKLSNAVTPEVVGADGVCAVTIVDPNNGTVLFNTAVSKTEGNTGTTNLLATVSLTVAIGQTVTVNYQTVAISATSGVDYVPATGSLTFPPGVLDQTVAIPIIGDTIDEPDEQLFIQLTNAVNAGISVGSNPPRITILDDDAAPAISVSDVGVIEPASGTAPAVFNVVLSNKSTSSVSVNFATADGTATVAGADYQSNSGTLVFSPGETAKQVTVQVNADAVNEPAETFFLNLTTPTNGTIADGQGLATIAPANAAAMQFNATSYSLAESAHILPVTVTRSGDTTAAASVQYQTNDASATYHSDYTPAYGVLAFAAGETSKTFNLLVNEDAFIEGDETFTISLTNASGGIVSGPAIVTVTITDSTSSATNPIDSAGFFVRQHYHDFLNREPDQSGLDFWTGQITSCGNDAGCIEVKRINVSGAFFLSIEFQQTGYLVERFYKVAYGDASSTSTLGGAHQLAVPVVRFNEFLQDTQRIGQGVVVLAPGWEQALENNKQAYAKEFVATIRFVNAFPTAMTPAAFVDKLNQNAGNVLSPGERTTAINFFSGAGDSSNTTARSQALRQVAEDQDLLSAESNRAFVLTQFFGYLRRNPNDAPDSDYTGYDFWLTKLNQFNGDYIQAEMVKAFISSTEYRQRFGP
jgi:Calx-beta domain/Domain of unknown function (DUF4214)